MTWKRSYGHKDKNHTAICDVFRRFGFSVAETQGQSGFCDAVISKSETETAIVEIKRREKGISIKQIEFLSAWLGNAAIVCSEDDAVKLCCDLPRFCLTIAQKSFLTRFCVQERYNGATDEKEYATNKILNLIKEI